MDPHKTPNGVSPQKVKPAFGTAADQRAPQLSPQPGTQGGNQPGPQSAHQGPGQGANRDADQSAQERLRSAQRPSVAHQRSVNVGNNERLASALGGSALVLFGLLRRSLPGLLLATAGGALVYRGLTGYCPLNARLGRNTADLRDLTVRVEKSVTIARPVAEIFAFWRNLENLPRFMNHVQSVTVDKAHPERSHWVVKAPMGQSVEWDAELCGERENEHLAWRAVQNAEVPNEGIVRFRPAPGGRGTEVSVFLRYDPPAGRLGVVIAKLLGEEPELQLSDDLNRLKQLLETGEIATTEGQPRGRG